MGRGNRATLGLVGAGLAGYGLYKAMTLMAAYYHLHPQYRDDISWGPILLRILPFLVAGIVLLRMARRASPERAGAISGPEGETLAMSGDGAVAGMAPQECPFCATELKAQATVCANCGAQKAVCQLGKIGLVGEAAVLPMKIIVAGGGVSLDPGPDDRGTEFRLRLRARPCRAGRYHALQPPCDLLQRPLPLIQMS